MKTDKEDVKRLITLLIADIVPEVWVPPVHVRELLSLVSFRWHLNKQITMSKNRLHSVIQRFNLIPLKSEPYHHFDDDFPPFSTLTLDTATYR